MYGVYGYMYGINRKAETRRSEENEKTKKMKKMKREKKTKKRKGKKKRKRASSLHGWQRRLPASLREVGLRCTAGDAGYRRRLARLDFALLAAPRSLDLHLWHVPGMRPSAIHLLHAAAMSRMLFSRVSSLCTRPLREVCGGLTIRERASWLLPSVSSRLSSPASMLRPCAPRRKNFRRSNEFPSRAESETTAAATAAASSTPLAFASTSALVHLVHTLALAMAQGDVESPHQRIK